MIILLVVNGNYFTSTVVIQIPEFFLENKEHLNLQERHSRNLVTPAVILDTVKEISENALHRKCITETLMKSLERLILPEMHGLSPVTSSLHHGDFLGNVIHWPLSRIKTTDMVFCIKTILVHSCQSNEC